MYCVHCGTEAVSSYCANCGHAIVKPNAAAQPAPAPRQRAPKQRSNIIPRLIYFGIVGAAFMFVASRLASILP